jgi:hypothetical protein
LIVHTQYCASNFDKDAPCSCLTSNIDQLTALLEKTRRERDAEQEEVVALRKEADRNATHATRAERIAFERGKQVMQLRDLLDKTRWERDAAIKEARRERDHYAVALKIIAEHCDHCGKYARDVLDGDYGAPPPPVPAPTDGIEVRCPHDAGKR